MLDQLARECNELMGHPTLSVLSSHSAYALYEAGMSVKLCLYVSAENREVYHYGWDLMLLDIIYVLIFIACFSIFLAIYYDIM